jgi:hypothetical protein
MSSLMEVAAGGSGFEDHELMSGYNAVIEFDISATALDRSGLFDVYVVVGAATVIGEVMEPPVRIVTACVVPSETMEVVRMVG